MLQSSEPADPRLSSQQPRKAVIKHQQNNCILLLFAILALFSFILLTSSPSPAQDPFVGKLMTVDSGTGREFVNIVRLGKNGYARAKIGDALFIGDTVKTGHGVKARIELADKSIINLGPDSILQMKAHLFAPAEAKRNYVFKALKGTIRFIIAKTFKPGNNGGQAVPWKDSNVTIETTTAVAGARGTDFVVTSITDGPVPVVEIAVFEGLVKVRSISLDIKEAIMLMVNQITRVQHGAGPGAAQVLTDARKNELIQLTTPAERELPKENSSGKKEDRPKKYGAGDAARDLAAGTTVAEVLDRCALAGMSVDDMVAAGLEAGIDPYVLVYTAITEGFPVQSVVSAAIRNGASLGAVITAASLAGGETNAIISGAADAGAPAEAIATAIANADTAGAPVYGYSLPMIDVFPSVSANIQSSIFAPSGATPSASIYKP